MTSPTLPAVAEAIRTPIRRFTQEFEPLRPDLYRYCRYLTHSPWDAEDLVQDTLTRAFVMLGMGHTPPVQPKPWLFKVASNRWINLCKKRRELLQSDVDESAHLPVDPRAMREAAGSLLVILPPQERAALVLKEVFDFSIEEISETLSTTSGAVKAALHRARGKVAEPTRSEDHSAPPAVIQQFCDAFNARDLDKVVSLLSKTVEVELSGTFVDAGVAVAKRSFGGLMFATEMAMNAGIPLEYRGDLLAEPPRFELEMHRGRPVVLTLWTHSDGHHVRGVSLLTASPSEITQIKTFMHAPELIEEVSKELGRSFRTNGYRSWELE